MIAAKEKIEITKKEVELWKAENKDLISQDEELPLETYIKLRYPDDTESQKNAAIVFLNQAHLI